MYKSVFVSYARKDLGFAERLVNDLKEHKVKVWFDKGNLRAGTTWPEDIRQAVAGHDTCIIIISNYYDLKDEGWLRREFYTAQMENRDILPVLIEDALLPDEVRQIQYASFVGFDQSDTIYQKGLDEVLQGLLKPETEKWDNPINSYFDLIRNFSKALDQAGETKQRFDAEISSTTEEIKGKRQELEQLQQSLGDRESIRRSISEIENEIEALEIEHRDFRFANEIKEIPTDNLYFGILDCLVKSSSDLEFGFVAFQNERWMIDPATAVGLNEDHIKQILMTLRELDPDTLTYETAYQLSGSRKFFGFAKIPSYKGKEAVIGFGTVNKAFIANRIFIKIVKTIFGAVDELVKEGCDPCIFDTRYAHVIEGVIFDQLRTDYRADTEDFRSHRLELFHQRLSDLVVLFQPIIDVDKNGSFPYVDSYEALARCALGGRLKLPKDVFETAALWDREFKLQLDIKLFETATNQYYTSRMEKRGQRRAYDERPLSVNVYPHSLLEPRFFKVVQRAITKTTLVENQATLINPRRIQAKNLILEISEKESEKEIFYTPGLPTNEVDSYQQFRKALKKYSDLGIHLAIDDFGKDNSQITRLDILQPSVVKIDRTLLLAGPGHLIETVKKIKARESLYPVKIVIEGFDAEATKAISLAQIQEAGISYVQGYGLTGFPRRTLQRLTDSKRRHILAQYAEQKPE
ncbi:MAG: TIR domain-containing protein [Anaerolineales bacterium]|nr:TIR domain-containing protein [Anaerolineales bacterium]